jgi:hypothetical protein
MDVHNPSWHLDHYQEKYIHTVLGTLLVENGVVDLAAAVHICKQAQ